MDSKLENEESNFWVTDSIQNRFGKYDLNSYKQYNVLSSKIINQRIKSLNTSIQNKEFIFNISSQFLPFTSRNIYCKKKISEDEHKGNSSCLPSIVRSSKYEIPKIMKLNMSLLKILTKPSEKTNCLTFGNKEVPISWFQISQKLISLRKSEVQKSSPDSRTKEAYTSIDDECFEK